MMQQVNLLTEDLRPRIEPLTVRQLVAAWSVLLGVLVLASLWQALTLWHLADARGEREQELLDLARDNAALKLQVRTEPQAALVTEVAALRDELRIRTRLLELVRGYEDPGADGFSGYLADLATQRVKGVALERIELGRGGSHILLSGQTEAPVHVPQLLRKLSDGGSFRGHRFDELRLEAQESGLLRFDIVGPAGESGG